MSKIKNVGNTSMAKCNHMTPLPFKGLNLQKTNAVHVVSYAHPQHRQR